MTPEQPFLEQILETLRETILPQSLGMGIMRGEWKTGCPMCGADESYIIIQGETEIEDEPEEDFLFIIIIKEA